MFFKQLGMWWLRLVGSLKVQVSFAKEPYKRDCNLQKRPIIECERERSYVCVKRERVYVCLWGGYD